MKKPIRLYWNENYAEKPPQAKKAIKKAVEKAADNLHLYPADLYDEVVSLIAKSDNVDSRQIILGHGIEGLVHLISKTFLNKNKVGGTFSPSYIRNPSHQ